MEDATTLARDATLVDPRRPTAPEDPTPSAPPAGPRTTVLPRVTGDGGALVVEGRSRYEPLSLLGEGGMGEVTLATDHDILRQVALKRLHPARTEAASVLRFADEVRTVGQLDHPNIVPIHDVGVDERGAYFYVMKFVDGETLESVIDHLAAGDPEYHRKYSFERRVQVFLGVLRAIQYAHARGVIHRDIKPANVMVGRYGEVMVMDWGIARRQHAPEAPRGDVPATSDDRFATRLGDLIGTPAYMSPEQARGAHDLVDERSDVYSLSVLFHELLTLEHYLASRTTLTDTLAGVQTVALPPPTSLAPHPHQGYVPAELVHFVRRGMAKDPGDRFRSVTAMIDALQNIAEGRIEVQCPITLMKRTGTGFLHMVDRHPRATMLGMMGGTLAFLAALAALALVAVRGLAA